MGSSVLHFEHIAQDSISVLKFENLSMYVHLENTGVNFPAFL